VGRDRVLHEIMRMTLDRIDWPRDDRALAASCRTACVGAGTNRPAHLKLSSTLDRCDPNVRNTRLDALHYVAASHGGRTADRLTLASLLLEAGSARHPRSVEEHSSRLGVPLGTSRACHAVPRERRRSRRPDAEPWATQLAWAEAMTAAMCSPPAGTLRHQS
jgi:hypothetical protein